MQTDIPQLMLRGIVPSLRRLAILGNINNLAIVLPPQDGQFTGKETQNVSAQST
jgi:hypothetical protein